jgi:hypothetical protein
VSLLVSTSLGPTRDAERSWPGATATQPARSRLRVLRTASGHRFARCTSDRPITSTSQLLIYFATLSDITWTSFLSAIDVRCPCDVVPFMPSDGVWVRDGPPLAVRVAHKVLPSFPILPVT